MRFLDALAQAKLKNLRFGLRRHRAEGSLAGRHRSVHYGFAQEFAHHRQYSQGDEIKFLDWKVYARKDRYFVKQFQEDKSLQTHVFMDISGSMGYQGAGSLSKWEHSCRLAMAVAYLVLRQDDAAGLVTFDTQRRTFLPPRRSLTQLELMDAELARSRPGGETDLASVLRNVTGLVRRRSIVVLVSDLLGDPRGVLEAVKVLRARRHEVFVMQVLDPRERELDLDGPVRFESMERDESLRCEAGLIREAYRDEFDRQQKLYHSGFHRAGIPYDEFYTDRPWDIALSGYLLLCSRF